MRLVNYLRFIRVGNLCPYTLSSIVVRNILCYTFLGYTVYLTVECAILFQT